MAEGRRKKLVSIIGEYSAHTFINFLLLIKILELNVLSRCLQCRQLCALLKSLSQYEIQHKNIEDSEFSKYASFDFFYEGVLSGLG